MARKLRFVPQDHLVEITCRTLQGRLLLRPSDELNEIIIGALGRAQSRYGLRLCGFAFLSNHYHLLAAPDDAKQMADFMCLVNSKIAREVGRLYNWREKVWGRRYTATVVAQEDSDQIERLRYIVAHGVKEGLVERVLDWPGVHCAQALLSGEPLQGYWFDRTKEYRARQRRISFGRYDFATADTVTLSPLPAWQHLSPAQQRERAQDLIDEVEHEAAVQRAAGDLPKPMGAKRIRRQRPHQKPQKLERSPAPAFHARREDLRRQLREAYAFFVKAYRRAAERLRQGDTSVQFPEGSFPPRLPFVRGSPLFDPG